jgi:hypothetical protein
VIRIFGWKQRFQNFKKAFNQLSVAVGKEDLSDLEKAGCIQFYEFTFELAWKTLHDYLKSQNVDVKFPRDTTRNLLDMPLLMMVNFGWICWKKEI